MEQYYEDIKKYNINLDEILGKYRRYLGPEQKYFTSFTHVVNNLLQVIVSNVYNLEELHLDNKEAEICKNLLNQHKCTLVKYISLLDNSEEFRKLHLKEASVGSHEGNENDLCDYVEREYKKYFN